MILYLSLYNIRKMLYSYPRLVANNSNNIYLV
jgi:hypothetical protein